MADTEQFDVIVLGSGAGGLTAAMTAAAKGRSVLLIEKADAIGGTLAWSGGGVWIPTNHHMSEVRETDSADKADVYIKSVLGNRYDSEMADAFVRNGAEAISFVEGLGPWIRFVPYAGSDYHPDLPGAAAKARSMLPAPFDGRQLGPWLQRLRRPKPEMTIFNGLQIETAEMRTFQDVFRSPTAFLKVMRRLAGYGKDLVRYGRGTRLIRGTALAAAFLRTAIDLGVTVRTNTTVSRLTTDTGGRVTGIAIGKGASEVIIEARHGVVLATGGFSGNADMRGTHIPNAADHLQLLPAENTGDGARLAGEIGASLGTGAGANAIYTPASSRVRPDGTRSVYPHFAFDRCKPGALLVGKDGHRFVNEAESYHTLVQKMHERGISPAWLIADRPFLRKYGMGLARPAPHPYRHLIREGYLFEAPTLDELAAKIGIDPQGLNDSARRMNEYAREGRDPDFNKGGDIYTRVLGDPEHKPNPCLGPISEAPFYALPLYPTDVGTSLGLAINPDAAVLNAAGQVIPGLYAAGLDAHAALRGFYLGAGTQIGQAMAFGYAAGRALAA